MKSDLRDRNGARRRRFWSSDEKRRMVAESFAPGASVSEVAQRYGVNANLLFTWRRQNARSAARGGAEPFELLPVRVSDERAPAAPVEASARVFVGRMEIVLAAGERILVGADVDTAALARVVKALSRR
jgi:transposase